MTVDYPILLPSFPELLRQENDLHPLVYLQLAAWLVSWVDMKVQQFHSQLKDCFWLYGEPGQRKIFFSLDKVDLLLVWTTSQSPFSVFRFSVKLPGQSIWGRPGVSYFERLSLSSVCNTPSNWALQCCSSAIKRDFQFPSTSTKIHIYMGC